MDSIEIETARLRLRQWREEDRAPFAALCADPVVMECFPARLNRAAADAMIDALQAGIAARGWGLWAVELRQAHACIGFIGIQPPRVVLPFSPCIEVGWRLAAEHWNQGYATEGARAALQTGFERIGLDEIVSFTSLANRRSRRVMQKLGMHESPVTFEHPSVPPGHALRTHCLYRLSRNDWRCAQVVAKQASSR